MLGWRVIFVALTLGKPCLAIKELSFSLNAIKKLHLWSLGFSWENICGVFQYFPFVESADFMDPVLGSTLPLTATHLSSEQGAGFAELRVVWHLKENLGSVSAGVGMGHGRTEATAFC